MKKKETWIKPRHRIIRDVFGPLVFLYSRLHYGIKVERFRDQGDRAYLILMNHHPSGPVLYCGSLPWFRVLSGD